MTDKKISRRDFIKVSSLATGGLFLQSCASYSHRRIASGKELDLLYYSDTLDTFEPVYLHSALRALSPVNLIGMPPWIKGDIALSKLQNQKLSPVEELLLGGPQMNTKFGGLPNLAGVLDARRQELNPEKTLVLENGQCWNGSGLAYLKQGKSGRDMTKFLNPDIRVLSDEFYLWNKESLENYRYLEDAGISTLATTLPAEVLEQNDFLCEYKIFTKGDVSVGVVSANNPHNLLGVQMLDAWFEKLQKTVDFVSSKVDLLLVLADVGNSAAFWLADNLRNVDLILAARGMEYWPEVVTKRRTPIYFSAFNALGASHLKFASIANKWLIEVEFLPADYEVLQNKNSVENCKNLIDSMRQSYSSYLDYKLAKTPSDIWQGDTLIAPVDILYKESLAKFYENIDLFLTLGLRYKVYIPKGEYIRREDIFRLTGSYNCSTYLRRTSGANLAKLLSNQANQMFGKLNLLDTSFDLPRLFGADWSYRYAGEQPLNHMADLPANSELAGFSTIKTPNNSPFITQLLEDYLLSQPKDWKLKDAEDFFITNAKGHPGWN